MISDCQTCQFAKYPERGAGKPLCRKSDLDIFEMQVRGCPLLGGFSARPEKCSRCHGPHAAGACGIPNGYSPSDWALDCGGAEGCSCA